MAARLNASQRAIMAALRDHDYARFYHGLTIGMAIHPYETRAGETPGGVWVMYGGRASPHLALERAGLIEPIARNVPGDWYKLTEAGHDRMMPKPPRPPRRPREPKWWHLTCAYCQGAGKVPGYAYGGTGCEPIKCHACSGRGTIKSPNPYREAHRNYSDNAPLTGPCDTA